jgi:pyruvate dehydrogenase E2 component (dihydrolipoamide acetyltransferase)
MAASIIMPKVDMVMETGTFVEWLKGEGEAVSKGEALFVIQTDKAAIEVEAAESGILANLQAKADDVIPVSQVIGLILQPGETAPQAAPQVVAPAPLPVTAVTAPPGPAQVEASGVRATPLARGLARELSLDLTQVSGSGPRGRIYRADVERFQAASQNVNATMPVDGRVEGLPRSPAPLSPQSQALPSAREKKRIPLKGAREIIARRMSYSASTIPHVHLTIQVDMSEAERLREKVNPVYAQRGGAKVSHTALLAQAVAQTLRKHAYLNASLADNEIILWEDVHLGIAVQLEEHLVVPVVRAAQQLKLEELAAQIQDLAGRARAKKLQPAEMSGSTFTITNLGMMGVVSFTAIINPPETAILAVGKIVDTPVAVGKEMALRPLMYLTLAVDHRVIDGAQAAAFLADLKTVLENPYLLA